MKFSRGKSKLLALGLSTLFLASCGNSDNSGTTVETDNNLDSQRQITSNENIDNETFFGEQPNTIGAFKITVTSSDSSPVDGSHVRIFHADTGKLVDEGSTDTTGIAIFSDITSGAFYNISVSHPGYTTRNFPLHQELTADTITEVSAILSEVTTTTAFNSDETANLSPQQTDGAEVSLPADAFSKTSNGSSPVNKTRAEITNIDVTQSNPLNLNQSGLLGETTNDDTELLSAYGATDFTFFEDSTDEDLQLNEGVVATIIIPIYVRTYEDGTPISVGDIMGIWYMDDQTGFWKKESDGVVIAHANSPTGLALQGEVTHFTTYMAGNPSALSQKNIITGDISYVPGEGIRHLRAQCMSVKLYTNVSERAFPLVLCHSNTKTQSFSLELDNNGQELTEFCLQFQLNREITDTDYDDFTFSMGNALNNVGPIRTECYNEYDSDVIRYLEEGQDGVHATVTFELGKLADEWTYEHSFTILGEPTTNPPGCEGNCAGGFFGGHIDVDTFTELGADSDVHDHEYDDDVDLTYVDYLNINNEDLTVCGQPFSKVGSGSTSQIRLQDEVECDKKFIILLNNADLSKSGILQIGTRFWNVVDYQKAVHQALINWDPTSGLPLQTTINGELVELSVSINDLVNNGGTLRLLFTSLSLGLAGVHPTNTGEVVDGNDYPKRIRGDQSGTASTDGRRRDGALMMQLIDLAAFNDANPLSKLEVQTPQDMADSIAVFDENGVEKTIHMRENGITYGGLVVAPSMSEYFIYSSTTFWHYDGDSWSDSGWIDDSSNAFDSIKNEWYEANIQSDLQNLGITGDLAQALVQVQAICDTDNNHEACDYLDILIELNE